MAKKIVAKVVEFDPAQFREIKRAFRASHAPSLSAWIREACWQKLERDDPAAAELARERAMDLEATK